MKAVPLRDLLVEKKVRVGSINGDDLPLLGVSNKIGLHQSAKGKLEDVSRYLKVEEGWFAYNPMRINVGSIGYASNPACTGIISPDYVVFSCNERICPEYLYHYLKSPVGCKVINENTGGSVRERLYFRTLVNIEIPLPGYEEQRRIANSLSALKEDICSAQNLLSKQIDVDVAKLRAAILQLAVQGKLVPQDARDEPAGVLLGRIRKTKGCPSKVNHCKLEESSIRLPIGWEACRLEDVAMNFITGPFGSSLHKSDYVQGGIPVINPASLKDERITPLPNMAVSEKTIKRLSSFVLNENDIVLARRGEMGRCALVTKIEEGWLCGTGSVLLRLSDQVYPAYFVKLIGSDAVREYLSGSSVGTTMSNLNQRILMDMPVLLPPLAEQHRIVTKVDQLMTLCDILEVKLNQARQQSEKLVEASVRQLLVA